jgi:hypothetical protein
MPCLHPLQQQTRPYRRPQQYTNGPYDADEVLRMDKRQCLVLSAREQPITLYKIIPMNSRRFPAAAQHPGQGICPRVAQRADRTFRPMRISEYLATGTASSFAKKKTTAAKTRHLLYDLVSRSR